MLKHKSSSNNPLQTYILSCKVSGRLLRSNAQRKRTVSQHPTYAAIRPLNDPSFITSIPPPFFFCLRFIQYLFRIRQIFHFPNPKVLHRSESLFSPKTRHHICIIYISNISKFIADARAGNSPNNLLPSRVGTNKLAEPLLCYTITFVVGHGLEN